MKIANEIRFYIIFQIFSQCFINNNDAIQSFNCCFFFVVAVICYSFHKWTLLSAVCSLSAKFAIKSKIQLLNGIFVVCDLLFVLIVICLLSVHVQKDHRKLCKWLLQIKYTAHIHCQLMGVSARWSFNFYFVAHTFLVAVR